MSAGGAASAAGAPALPLGRGVRVAAAGPGGLLALEKPAGVLTHPNEGRAAGSPGTALLAAAYDHGREAYHWPAAGPGGPGELFLINRLDSPTSGLVLAALDAATAAAARRAFAEGGARKTYFALVLGRPHPPRGQWTDRLARAKPGGPAAGRGVRVSVGAGKDSQTALTRYAEVETQAVDGARLTLLRLEPVTGRTHQLRVQCAAHGCPILGDATYGDFKFNRAFARRSGEKRLFLHAAALRLPGLNFAAESPLPAEFRALQAKR